MQITDFNKFKFYKKDNKELFNKLNEKYHVSLNIDSQNLEKLNRCESEKNYYYNLIMSTGAKEKYDIAKQVIFSKCVINYYKDICEDCSIFMAQDKNNFSLFYVFDKKDDDYPDEFLLENIISGNFVDKKNKTYCVIFHNLNTPHVFGLYTIFVSIFNDKKKRISNVVDLRGDEGEYTVLKGKTKDYFLLLTKRGYTNSFTYGFKLYYMFNGKFQKVIFEEPGEEEYEAFDSHTYYKFDKNNKNIIHRFIDEPILSPKYVGPSDHIYHPVADLIWNEEKENFDIDD